MDDFFKRALKIIKEKISIEPIILPQELTKVRLPFGLVDIRCYNWKSERIRKIYFLRLKTVFSFLDVVGIGIYPEPMFDLPILNCDLNGMKKKVSTMINFTPLFNEPSYFEKYIKPMEPVHDKYKHFPRAKISDFLKPHVTPYAAFIRTEKTSLKELSQCGIDYLNLYLDLLSRAEEIKDTTYQKQVEQAQTEYLNNLLNNDPSRKMLGKIIGKNRADRIFFEVLA